MTSFPPPTHRYCGSDSERQSVGDPGHCEECAEYGHVLAHPDLGCGDVGCYSAHGPEDEEASNQALLELAERQLSTLSEQAKNAYRQYRDLDSQQAAKAEQVRELRRRIRESDGR
jgi:hypothetical protein